MKTRLISFLLHLALSSVASAAIVDDIGPNTVNGTVNSYGRNDSAGQPIALAGNSSATYVVSLNSGVWKSVNGAPWVQLANSPPRAYSMAIDPNNASHLAVGERDGDAVDIRLNGSGVWESFDGGNTWPVKFDPLSVLGCTSQAIPSLAFSGNGTLFIVGPCGIGRKPAGGGNFDFSGTPPNLGLVTVVVASESKVWARTATKLLVSSDDGMNWMVIDIPQTVDGYTIAFPNNPQGDPFSLGALDSGAYMTFKPNPNENNIGNRNTLLVYNAANGHWLTQLVNNSGDGTGLGGRRFVKSFVLNRLDLPPVVGQRLQLFVGVGQEVYAATGLNSDGTVSSWTQTVGTRGMDPPGPDPVHSDVWDFNLALDASKAWLANDGGVYSKTWPSGAWGTQNQNLFTHYIYTLNTFETDLSLRQRLAFSGPDNDAWYYDHLINQWTSVQFLGDANFSVGDTGNDSIALMWRTPGWRPCCGGGQAALTGFSANLPSGTTLQQVTLNPDEEFDGPLFLNFIQTLKNESPTYPLGDAVMLVKLPLHYVDGGGNQVAVPGPLGQPNPSGAPVLIRNTQFAGGPDANSSRFQNWQIVADDLPSNANGFWVSGGHANPVYYAYTINEPAGNLLYKRNASGAGWSLLNVSGLLNAGWHGPAFVNPYDPNRVYVLTGTGIQVSTDGGASFQNDTALTALLTGSGTFPLTDTFTGGNGNYLARNFGSHGVAMGTLSDMAFSRERPNEVVAASPFTGVFLNSGSGGWMDLTSSLPQPLASVSAVGISGPNIFVATQGRGLLRLLLDDASHCFLTGPVLSVGPSDPYHTVTAAYNDASQGCTTISINTGTYHEAPMILNKHVRLESHNGPSTIRP